MPCYCQPDEFTIQIPLDMLFTRASAIILGTVTILGIVDLYNSYLIIAR